MQRLARSGPFWFIASCFAFASMWVMIRYTAQSLHSFEIVFFRNFIGLLFLVPMMLRNRGLIRLDRMKVHLGRATSGFIATMGTFYAVANAPLATTLAINYTAPLFGTLGAVMVLGERIRARRIAALAVGFVGMLLVLRPGHLPMTPGIAAGIISAVSTGYSIVAMRSLVGVDDSRAVAAWTFILTTLPSLAVALFVWTPPPPAVWPLLAGIGAAAAIGQLTLTKAFSLSEASAVLPLDFVRFGLITAAGVFLFGETYDALTLAGGALILASTIYLAWREAQLKRQQR
ncbi:DMT family transporter [Sandarakinorhabdus oryzae]|uniref:DMT family transporter n=1 Tax=Sandarakinorhabdus oryzae TaxID=2675220 RepID=UPI0012E25CCE|nr:DMT family transporter [Sandarakinorhabdus oryzae]